jgi:hypothetical protein
MLTFFVLAGKATEVKISFKDCFPLAINVAVLMQEIAWEDLPSCTLFVNTKRE